MTPGQKRINVVVGINDFRVGGAQKVVADIIAKFNLHDFDLSLVTLSQSPQEASFYEAIPSGITVHKLNFSSFYDVRSWKQLYRLLKASKPDIVWSHLYFSNTVFRVLQPLLRYKVITVEHNTYVHKTSAQKLVDWCLSFFTYAIVAVSDQVADFTSVQEHIPRKKFITILNGVAVDEYNIKAAATDIVSKKQALGFSPEDKIIITVGQLIKQKNHRVLIEAFATFASQHQSYKLIIVGEGRMREELEECIHRLNLQDSVRLLGIQKDTPSFYAISDVFVLPSLFEGFALVCIEAMACGLPVLTTKVAGPDRYITHGEDGLFFEPTKDALCVALSQYADMDDVQKAAMGEAARKKASQYDIHHAVTAYEALFKTSVQ